MSKLLATAVLILSVALLGSGCSETGAQQAGDSGSPDAPAENVRIPNVEVQSLRRTDLEEYITLTGHTESMQDVVIASELGGTVMKLNVDRGDRVSAGQVLAEVSADIYGAQLEEARANLRLKQAALKKAKALYERESISSMQRLQAQVEHDAAAAQVEMAESRLERAVVRAPFSGIIDDRFVDTGEMVGPGGQLFRLVDNRRMKIRSEFAELDVTAVEPGIEAAVLLDAFPDTVFRARLSFVAATSEPGSRTFPCEFVIENPANEILGGMLGRARVLKTVHHEVIVLPQTALVETETGRNVFVLDGEKAQRKNVQVGASNNGRVVISRGLESNEMVIVTGQRDLVDGQRVNVTARKEQ